MNHYIKPMNSSQQLVNIIDELRAQGVEPKVTKLPTRKAKTKGWFKGNGPTPNCGLHTINKESGYNTHGNKVGKLG